MPMPRNTTARVAAIAALRGEVVDGRLPHGAIVRVAGAVGVHRMTIDRWLRNEECHELVFGGGQARELFNAGSIQSPQAPYAFARPGFAALARAKVKNLHKNPRRKAPIGVCEECGGPAKVFTGRRGPQPRFCEECKTRKALSRLPKCSCCGVTLPRNAKACAECRRKAKVAKQHVGTCVGCGEVFRSTIAQHHCGAVKCRDVARAAYQAERRKRPEVRALALLRFARERAAARGLAVEVTSEWVTEKLRSGVCMATGIPFVVASKAESGLRGPHPFSASLDRIDPAHGYTPDNCQVVANVYNMAKGEWGHDAVLQLARAVVGKWGMHDSRTIEALAMRPRRKSK